MTFRLSDLPIARKLLVMGLASIALALALNYAISLASTFFLMRASVVADLAGQSRVVADNAAAALVFDDFESARETLAGLRENPSIEIACLYDFENLVARFERQSNEMSCPAAAPLANAGGMLTGARAVTPVDVSGTRAGTLYLHASYDEIWAQLRAQAFGAGLALLASALAAVMFIGRLNRNVADPVRRLASVASHISRHHDYGVRAVRQSNDEIGALVDAFNDMVTAVQERETALSRTNLDLSREIVERQRAEQDRAAMLEREKQANRLKDEFLAALSHELRTPLNAILGWTQILRTTGDISEKDSRALASVERNARAQARMIEDLLDISRIVTGKFRLNLQAVDPVGAVDAALDVVRPMTTAKGIELARSVEIAECFVSADPDRLHQVLWNLLSNAVKFTPSGGRISVNAACVDDMVAIEVADTGTGIAPDFLPHVFDRFRQADGSATRQYGGLGLGLSIVHEIAQLHGGTARAYSDGLGRGARFVVSLPIMKIRPATSSAAAPAGEGPRFTGTRILVVDDDADAREIAALALRASGAEVVTAGSPGDAIAIAAREEFAVIVCDIGMPGMDGYALLAHLHQQLRDQGRRVVPAVAMTAHASRDDIARAAAAGFRWHVAKPIDTAALVHAAAQAASAGEAAG